MQRRDFHGTYSGTYSKKWTGLIPKIFRILIRFRLALLLSVTYFNFLYRPPSSSLYMVVDPISTNIDEILSINPRADVFVFKDSNFHHKDGLKYSGGTCRFDVIIFLSQTSLLRLTFLLGFLTVILSLSLYDLFISSDTSLCYVMSVIHR